MRFFALALILLAASPSAPSGRYLVSWAMETTVYPGSGAGHDFLAIFDISDSPNFGNLVATIPVETRAQMAHHTNYTMPPNHMLFANDFMAGRSYVFDLRDPHKPLVAASFTGAGPYQHAHSFAYLSNGNVLATYQIKGPNDDTPGALVELDAKGRMVRTSDASAPHEDPYIRPYSLQVIENIDRVVTTSADMFGMATSKPSHVVQVWRLSDLKLLKTIVLPKPALNNGVAAQDPDEARVLSDGSTVLVKTGTCGLYRLTGLSGANPAAEFIYDFGYRGCSGVPVVAGKYWIQSSMTGHSIIALDVSDPAHPVEVSHLFLGSTARPHWIALESGTGNLVITGFGSMLNHIYFATVDLQTGALTLDNRTIDFNRHWPDGWDGPAVPHGTLFY
jgi:hypothetical protein